MEKTIYYAVLKANQMWRKYKYWESHMDITKLGVNFEMGRIEYLFNAHYHAV